MVDLDVVSVGEQDRVIVEGTALKLHATAVDPVSVGDTVRLAMRPEDMSIAADDASGPSNTIPADVAVVEYHGREFAVGATTSAGLTMHVRSDFAPAVGQQVLLTVDPARALVFRADLDPDALSQEERDLEEVRT